MLHDVAVDAICLSYPSLHHVIQKNTLLWVLMLFDIRDFNLALDAKYISLRTSDK